jgi:N-methylhydantoinase A/oxoprolinase/acetone carboxylase beta subunit
MIRAPAYRVAFDIGGTFTDVVVTADDGRRSYAYKTLTTPSEPSDGVVAALAEALEECGISPADVANVVVGATTLVTNTLLERKGARTALITTRGFRDLLEIAREWRYDIFDLDLELPEPLVPRHLRFEVGERIDARAHVTVPIDPSDVHATLAALSAQRVEAVAVCFLHSYLDDRHEQTVARTIRTSDPAIHVSVSAEVLPEVREYPRLSATVLNAYVQPIVAEHIAALGSRVAEALSGARLFLMQSNGGFISTETAAALPIRLLESGPAAGALAAADYAGRLDADRVVSFDMGGTTAKACIVEDGSPKTTLEFEAGRQKRFAKGSGYPVHLASVDLIEIGAGGGSVARVDALGLLKVGPDSQGARPGPACYGFGGGLPTVTDADVILGYLDPEGFLGGSMRLDPAAAVAAVREHIAEPLGISVVEAASGIHRVASNAMASAVRVHLAEHGCDPQRFALFAFGGAGPMHAREIARTLRMQEYIVPPHAGVGSAVGLLAAPPKVDASRSQPSRLDELDWRALAELDAQLRAKVEADLALTGVDASEARIERSADLRYVGQGYEVHVPVALDAVAPSIAAYLEEQFKQRYRELYGGLHYEGAVEMISWRVSATGAPSLVASPGSRDGSNGEASAAVRTRPVYFHDAGGFVETPVYRHAGLREGFAVDGPALIEQRDSTILIGPGDRAILAAGDAIRVTGAWRLREGPYSVYSRGA